MRRQQLSGRRSARDFCPPRPTSQSKFPDDILYCSTSPPASVCISFALIQSCLSSLRQRPRWPGRLSGNRSQLCAARWRSCKSAPTPTSTPRRPTPLHSPAHSVVSAITRTPLPFLHSRSTETLVARMHLSSSNTSWSALSVPLPPWAQRLLFKVRHCLRSIRSIAPYAHETEVATNIRLNRLPRKHVRIRRCPGSSQGRGQLGRHSRGQERHHQVARQACLHQTPYPGRDQGGR